MKVGRTRYLGVGAALVVLCISAAVDAADWGEVYRLPNGLRVILSPDHRFPSVTVLVRYHVGARQEPQDRSGIAHLLEHLTFRIPRPSPRAGTYSSFFTVSSGNGSTSYEETNYYTTAPSGDLAYALWKERWRMGLRLADITDSIREDELDIVKNERRQRIEIAPYRAGRNKLWTALFPEQHPFHDEVIGSIEELESISLAEAKEFFTGFYGPNNATLAVVGDFDLEKARSTVEGYYGSLAARPAPAVRAAIPQTISREVEIRHDEQYGRRPRLSMAWHTPPRFHEENATGDVAAMVLGGLNASRLFLGVSGALWVTAHQQSFRSGSVFHIEAEPEPGVALEDLTHRIDAVLSVLATHPPPQEQIEASVRRILRSRILTLENTLAKAHLFVDVLSETETQEDPIVFERKRYTGVGPEAVSRFISTHLARDKRVVLYATPQEAR